MDQEANLRVHKVFKAKNKTNFSRLVVPLKETIKHTAVSLKVD